jgi:hypothetical protein
MAIMLTARRGRQHQQQQPRLRAHLELQLIATSLAVLLHLLPALADAADGAAAAKTTPPPTTNATTNTTPAKTTTTPTDTTPAPTNIPEIGASIMVLGKYDWEVWRYANNSANSSANNSAKRPWSRCLDQLWRAQRIGSSVLNFVVTSHWLPPPAGRASNARGAVALYCVMDGTEGHHACIPWTPALVANFRDSLALCFAEAMRGGLTVSVRPHLDDASPARAWRDGLAFDPLADYGGWSYKQIMLNPVADALALALKETRAERERAAKPAKVYFSLQGEMGVTIARFPASWATLADEMRARVLRGGGDQGGDDKVVPSKNDDVDDDVDVLVGIGINFTGLFKEAQAASLGAFPIFGWLLAGPAANRPSPAVAAPNTASSSVKSLIEGKIDFLGLSAYAPMTGAGFALNEFENAAFNVRDNLASYGVDLLKLVNSGAIELHYSELGLGGAGRDSRGMPAPTAREAARALFAGVDAARGVFVARLNPWAVPTLRAFAVEFYTKLSVWLAAGSTNKTFKVSKVFIWSHGSFDVLGIVSFFLRSAGAPSLSLLLFLSLNSSSRSAALFPP